MVNEGASMNVDSKNGSKEIRINYPSEFDGNRENLENFLQDCHLYLAINEEIYNTDMKKIVFMLSFMKKGTASTWKESWTQEKLNTPTQDFGKIKDFIDELKKAFSAADTEGDARAKLRQLRQGKNTIDEYVAEFRILAGKAKMTDDKALTEYFMEGINTGILQKIFASEQLPKTIQEWYERASKHDAQHRRVQEILERRRGSSSTTTSTTQPKKPFIPRYVPRYANTTRDPNAMDIDQITTTIDRLTNEEREKHIRENRCFKCHKIGHISRNCRSGQQPNVTARATDERALVKYEGKKTANTARAMIRNLVAEMDKEEKDKLFEKMMNDEDF
jgi:Retrotransposon gag protein